MPEFILQGKETPSFKSLDEFTQGYIQAIFFTEEERLTEELNGESPSFDMLEETALMLIISDCKDFQKKMETTLLLSYDWNGQDAYSAEQAGMDFWYTRNHHGVGFWDREELKNSNAADILTDFTHKTFKELDVFAGEGKVFF